MFYFLSLCSFIFSTLYLWFVQYAHIWGLVCNTFCHTCNYIEENKWHHMYLWSVITLTCQKHTWWCAFTDVKSSVSPEMMICSKGWPRCCGCNSIFCPTNELNKCPFLFIWPVVYPNRRLDNGLGGFLILRFLNTRADHLWDKKNWKFRIRKVL